MAPRKVIRSERIDIPRVFVELAQRRTEFLLGYATYGDVPLRMLLANAWMQGAADTGEALDRKQQRDRIAAGIGMDPDQSCTGEEACP